jgi:hypothetical protein
LQKKDKSAADGTAGIPDRPCLESMQILRILQCFFIGNVNQPYLTEDEILIITGFYYQCRVQAMASINKTASIGELVTIKQRFCERYRSMIVGMCGGTEKLMTILPSASAMSRKIELLTSK